MEELVARLLQSWRTMGKFEKGVAGQRTDDKRTLSHISSLALFPRPVSRRAPFEKRTRIIDI